MVKKYDVVIAGGGPSGLSAAAKAASMGCSVLVMEMQSQIGGQGQAAWVGGGIWKAVPASLLSRIREVTLRCTGESLTVRGNFGVVLDRRTFDRGLALRAADAGADIWLSSPVRDLLFSDGRVVGVKSGLGSWAEEVRADVVIDATGSRGEWSCLFMRRVAQRELSREEISFSSEYLVAKCGEKAVNLVFSSYLTPGGHGWVYPCGNGMAAVGVHGVRINPELALDEFIGRDSVRGLKGSVPVAAFRSQFPLIGPLDRAHGAGIVAVGGAAGQIYQLSPRGLEHAVRAGEIAGEAAAEAVSSRETSEEGLSGYEQAWREKLYGDLRIGKMLRNSLSTFQDRKMSSIISAARDEPKLARALVDVFLCRNLGRSVRSLLRSERISRALGVNSVEGLLD
ncbi:MAG: NAD(P)/FAD-dependent oxidoreductase [Candidatus Hadarchaeales archaeon]